MEQSLGALQIFDLCTLIIHRSAKDTLIIHTKGEGGPDRHCYAVLKRVEMAYER